MSQLPTRVRRKNREAPEDRNLAMYRMIGERLRQYRISRGMSQDDLAEAARLTQATVSALETGKSGPGIRVETLIALARALKVSIDVVLGVDDIPIPEEDDVARDAYPNRRRLRLLPEFIALPRDVKRHIVGLEYPQGDIPLFEWIKEVERAVVHHSRGHLDLPNAPRVPTVEELNARRTHPRGRG